MICASHTGRLLPKVDWATSNPDSCSVFDRQSNNRVSSKTYEDFPQFVYAFASLGRKTGTALSEKSWSKREYPDMFVYYYHTQDVDDNPIVFSMLSTIGADSKPVDILLASPEAIALAEAPIISSEILNYLVSISSSINTGGSFQIRSTRKSGVFSTISFGETSEYRRNYTLRAPLWGVGEHGKSPTSFRYQLDKMITAIKDLQIVANELRNNPSSEQILSIKAIEKRFRDSYNLLLSMPSWKKNNPYDGVSRSALRWDMKSLTSRIEKLLGLTSRRLGMGISQQVKCGLDAILSTKISFGGGVPLSASWDPRTRSGTFKHISSTHRLYFEELSSQDLLGKDIEITDRWIAHDNSLWMPKLIASPRAASFFDSRLASDERVVLRKISAHNENQFYVDGALIIDIMSKKNPQKSKGEQYLRIYEEIPLILSATYNRSGLIHECAMHSGRTSGELENAEIIALAINLYANAACHFKESGHVAEGIGNQKRAYISETKLAWRYVIESILPDIDSHKLEQILSTAESIYSINIRSQQSDSLTPDKVDYLAQMILQMTGQCERSELIEPVARILKRTQ
jgi:hypothetical protein